MNIQTTGGAINPTLGFMPFDPAQRLKKVAEDMEAVFADQILQEARPKSSAFGDSFAQGTFQDMFSQVLSQKIAGSHTLGVADAIIKQVSQQTAAEAQQAGTTQGRTSAAQPDSQQETHA